ncbi:MAG: bifunctional adenosylcobinamide kinase/adenosylcobinamide-phosphate guanylyltransferase [Lachnospiraceae bacterium]|nr:bifunctional adenosylcobinamide kinase/adenosylcobinamide-phosphate guanylyltransferase [Lachnospiraceae bacterium]
MMTVIIGTPDSGKSALAEELALQTGDPYRYYLATMKVMDDAAAERVAKHRTQRAGKGFVTVERERDISDLAESLDHAAQATVLLECVSNLVGNEMHDDPQWANLKDERFAEAVVSDIVHLAERVHHLIIVTNTYAQEDSGYDDDTCLYVNLLDKVNERLILIADRTIDLR